MPSFDESDRYGEDKSFWVTAIYLVAVMIWILIVLVFGMYRAPGAFILLVPILIFLIAIFNAEVICPTVENEMFKASYLSVGLAFALSLLVWMSKDYTGDKTMFTATVIICMVLTLFTLIDVWVPREWLFLTKHARSAIQTMSIALFMFALITYFMSRTGAALP